MSMDLVTSRPVNESYVLAFEDLYDEISRDWPRAEPKICKLVAGEL